MYALKTQSIVHATHQSIHTTQCPAIPAKSRRDSSTSVRVPFPATQMPFVYVSHNPSQRYGADEDVIERAGEVL